MTPFELFSVSIKIQFSYGYISLILLGNISYTNPLKSYDIHPSDRDSYFKHYFQPLLPTVLRIVKLNVEGESSCHLKDDSICVHPSGQGPQRYLLPYSSSSIRFFDLFDFE